MNVEFLQQYSNQILYALFYETLNPPKVQRPRFHQTSKYYEFLIDKKLIFSTVSIDDVYLQITLCTVTIPRGLETRPTTLEVVTVSGELRG